jgi:hypothetical protein
MSGQGSAGNVISASGSTKKALTSFVVPGLGQLLQGRLMMAIVMFVLAGVLWFFQLGWTNGNRKIPISLAVHLWSMLDAALWKRKS